MARAHGPAEWQNVPESSMLSQQIKDALRPYVPKPLLIAKRRVRDLAGEIPLARLEYLPHGTASFSQRRELVQKIRQANGGIQCMHTHAEMERIITAILEIPASVQGCIVEAGCYQGGSTAKLSLAGKLVHRKLFVFDSFEGLPENTEPHKKSIFGEPIDFARGRYAARLERVRANVRKFGVEDVCEFVPGWFDDTMPGFREPIAAAFIDVDLAASTKTCLKYLYPLIVPGGSLFSHDGHLPLCQEVFSDAAFWTNEVGCVRPPIPGLGRRKLLQITKPAIDGGRTEPRSP
jgi:O-methyltransferase